MTTLPSFCPDGNINNKTTFIYSLIDPQTKLIRYVGKADNPQLRFGQHLADRQKTHKTNWIKSLTAKGLIPELVIIEEVHVSQWQERECYWIAYYRELGYKLVNRTDGGEGASGFIQSEEQKLKTSKSHKESLLAKEARRKLHERQTGRTHTQERIRKLSEAGKARTDLYKMHEAVRGRIQSQEEREMRSKALLGIPKSPFTEEHRQNLSKAHKDKPGHAISDESRKKISEAHKGRIFSEEHRRKLSESHKGKRQPLSEETKRKISEANKGKQAHPVTDEMRRKISEAGKGRRLSEDNIRKMQEGRKRSLELRRVAKEVKNE